jgi:hypothetical protein
MEVRFAKYVQLRKYAKFFGAQEIFQKSGLENPRVLKKRGFPSRVKLIFISEFTPPHSQPHTF